MTMDTPDSSASVAPQGKSRVFHKGVIVEWVLLAVIVAELLTFLWLFIHPDLFRKAPVVPAGAPQVIASNPDQPAGGGIAMPGSLNQGSAPAEQASPTPGSSDGKDDSGHAAAAKGEDLHVYLSIDNAGAATTLTGASSPQASSVSLWQTGLAGASPAEAASIPIAAKGVTPLDDQHGWIVLGGLTDDFRKGDRIEVTLAFEGADPVTLSVPIYRTSDTAAANREAPVTAGDLTLGAFWAEPFAPGE